MKTVKEILIEARALISDRKNWTTGVYAKNHLGLAVNPSNRTAVCFCIRGAIARAAGDNYSEATIAASEAAKELFGTKFLACDINDNPYRGHNAVLSVLDKAIENQ